MTICYQLSVWKSLNKLYKRRPVFVSEGILGAIDIVEGFVVDLYISPLDKICGKKPEGGFGLAVSNIVVEDGQFFLGDVSFKIGNGKHPLCLVFSVLPPHCKYFHRILADLFPPEDGSGYIENGLEKPKENVTIGVVRKAGVKLFDFAWIKRIDCESAQCIESNINVFNVT
jgi:hypothetical protein